MMPSFFIVLRSIIMHRLFALLVSLPLCVGYAPSGSFRAAFGVRRAVRPLFSTAASSSELAERYFQIEEMEDQDTCTTELFLHSDLSVEIHDTDGPRYSKAAGTWNLNGDSFSMVLSRTFDTGREASRSSDVGEFPYKTIRRFTGTLSKIGGKTGVEDGVIHDVDAEGEDREIGYFEMIDTTEERMGQQ